MLSWQYRFHLSDAAVCALLLFLGTFLRIINKVAKSEIIAGILKCLPSNVSKCRKLLNVKENHFEKLVSCVKCDTVYNFEACCEKSGGKVVSKRCTHVEFQYHPYSAYRKPCGALLLKQVKIFSKQFCYPYRTYCYLSIITSLEHLLSRKDILSYCEHWRNRKSKQDVLMMDVYGMIFKLWIKEIFSRYPIHLD